MRKDLIRFRHRLLQMDLSFSALDFEAFSLENFGPGDLIYCDPPYLSTTGSYNDGNRGYESWTVQDSLRLMDYLDRADAKGISFVMTNLLEGEGESNRFLADWSKKYYTAPLKGSRGQLKESVIWNR